MNELEPDEEDDVIEAANDEGEPFIVPRYHMRERRQRDYSHRLDHQMDVATSAKSYEPEQQMLQIETSSVMTKIWLV